MTDPFKEKAVPYVDRMPAYPWMNTTNRPVMIRLFAEFGKECYEEGYAQRQKEGDESDV